MVLTVRILQTLGFHPCYVFIPDSLQAQWITVRSLKLLHLNQICYKSKPASSSCSDKSVCVVCVHSPIESCHFTPWIFSASHWAKLAFIAFFAHYLSLGTTQSLETQNKCNPQFLASSPTLPTSLPGGFNHQHEMAIIGSLILLCDLCLQVAKKSTREGGLNAGFHESRVILKGVIIYILHPFIIIGF